MAMSKCSRHSPTQGIALVLDRLTGSIRLFCIECGGVQNKFFNVGFCVFVEFVFGRAGVRNLSQSNFLKQSTNAPLSSISI